MRKRLIEKFKYSFDNAMSRGLLPLIGLLTLFTVVFVALITMIVSLFHWLPDHQQPSFGEIAWLALLRTLDAGTMAGDAGLGFRAAMFVVTIFGVILVATLIGIISNALSSRVELLRKGRSNVLESNHTVILGWNSKAVQIICELVEANESEAKASIVILASKEKLEIEDEIHQRIKTTKKTKVVVRNGDPMSKLDLAIVAIDKAKSVVILSPDHDIDADSFAIKTCLAVRNLEKRPSADCSIVAEIKDASNMEAAQMVGEGEVHWILGEELINRLIAQSCRQAGISGAFTDLLDFEGSEIYFYFTEELIGKTYRDINMCLVNSHVMGISRDGETLLNPDPTTVFKASDKLIILAEDNRKISWSKEIEIQDQYIVKKSHTSKEIDRILIVGSNKGLESLLLELENELLPGSEVTLVASSVSLRHFETSHLTLNIVMQDPTNRAVLEKVEPHTFDHIIILATREGMNSHAADSRTLLSLLHLRLLTKDTKVNIVTEILDDHNRELVESNRVDDFIVSDKLVSHAIAQLSENKDLHPVFDTLFSAEPPHILMAPIEQYVALDQQMDFAVAVEAGHRFNESVIGYRSEALKQEQGELHGVRPVSYTHLTLPTKA